MSLGNEFLSLRCINEARAALRANGCLVVSEVYSKEYCNEVARWMDDYVLQGETEINYKGSECRIWGSQEKSELLRNFLNQCNVFMSCMEGKDMEAFSLLAIRNRAIQEDDLSMQLGRWHIDSFRRQLKIFLFLTDVRESTGCFEFIPGTHKSDFKTKMVVRGQYFSLRDLYRKGGRAYSRLADSYVEKLAVMGYKPSAITCPAGTIMVIDSSAVHRARPCFEGARYALTAYYR